MQGGRGDGQPARPRRRVAAPDRRELALAAAERSRDRHARPSCGREAGGAREAQQTRRAKACGARRRSGEPQPHVRRLARTPAAGKLDEARGGLVGGRRGASGSESLRRQKKVRESSSHTFVVARTPAAGKLDEARGDLMGELERTRGGAAPPGPPGTPLACASGAALRARRLRRGRAIGVLFVPALLAARPPGSSLGQAKDRRRCAPLGKTK